MLSWCHFNIFQYMTVCACVCVCAHVRVCACMCVCMCVGGGAHMCESMHECVYFNEITMYAKVIFGTTG